MAKDNAMIEIVNFEEEYGPQLEAFRDRLFDVAADTIEKATLPIFHTHDKQLVEGRSGLLFQIDQALFLVTAAHGMAERLKEGLFLNVVMSKEIRPIILHLEDFQTTNDPHLDLCVMQLDPSSADYIRKNYIPLRLDSVMLRKNPRQAKGIFYMLAGYPIANLEIDETGRDVIENWKYLTYSYNGNYDNVENYNPLAHLIVKYERDTKNYRGETVHPPGLSGCGIWFVGDPFRKPLFTSEDFKLVGIQTAWHRGHEYAKCTWIDHVLAVIWRYYPDARAPMRLQGIQF